MIFSYSVLNIHLFLLLLVDYEVYDGKPEKEVSDARHVNFLTRRRNIHLRRRGVPSVFARRRNVHAYYGDEKEVSDAKPGGRPGIFARRRNVHAYYGDEKEVSDARHVNFFARRRNIHLRRRGVTSKYYGKSVNK